MKVITIGRSTENNDIVVNDEKVSRNHLQMVMDDNGSYSVVDLGSTNGTYVNGQRISGEVRLQLSDEVRIGQTVLPWRNYFPASPQPPTKNLSMSPQPPKQEPNHTWLYVIIGAALLLLIGGGVAWKVYNNKQKEKVEQQKKEEDAQMKQEADEARIAAAKLSAEAARLSEEAEKAKAKAAETKSEKDLKYAEEMRVKAEEADGLAKQKEAQWMQMKAELEAANKEKKAAEDKSAEDAKAKEEAELKAKQAQNEAAKAKQDRDYAEENARLTKEFYGLISKIKPKEGLFDKDYFGSICEKMNWNPGRLNKKDFIEKQFDKADNVEKNIIINEIKKVLGQQTKDEKVGETETKSKNEGNDIEQPTPTINDTVKQ